MEDLRALQARVAHADPLDVSRQHAARRCRPSSSGGVTMTETLNILEGFDPLPPFGSTRWAHLVGSAFQRAFVDRNAKLGDPAFVQRADRAAHRQARTRRSCARRSATTRATPTTSLDGDRAKARRRRTTRSSTRRGNAVAMTTTLNDLFGSGVYLASAGFFLNDEMDDFAAQPGTPNMYGLVQGEANAIAAGQAHAERDVADDRARSATASCCSSSAAAAARASSRARRR